jgi:flagellar basal-body rod protein FlgB
MSEIRKIAEPPNAAATNNDKAKGVTGTPEAEDFSMIFRAALDRALEPAPQQLTPPTHSSDSASPGVAWYDIAPALNKNRHFPLSGGATGPVDDNFHKKALGLRVYRQQLLASNIANADTPGYKAVDIDISAAIRNGLSTRDAIPLLYHVETQGSVDGNTVDMDVERAKFAENAVMLEFELQQVGEKERIELLKNLPY